MHVSEIPNFVAGCRYNVKMEIRDLHSYGSLTIIYDKIQHSLYRNSDVKSLSALCKCADYSIDDRNHQD